MEVVNLFGYSCRLSGNPVDVCALSAGVEFVDIHTVYIDEEVKIGAGTMIAVHVEPVK